jgi:hypothetical protein
VAGYKTTQPQYPIGIQTFAKVIEDELLYVDKTAVIYDLIDQGSVYFFLRPRRFGKSLLLSTLESVFLGRKALFEGLAIAKTDYDFTVYPVIRLDFSRVVVKQSGDLENHIKNTTNEMAKTHDIDLTSDSYEQIFSELVVKLQQKYQQKVVLLVDEYDKPILSHLNKPTLPAVKDSISGFYAAIKSLDGQSLRPPS